MDCCVLVICPNGSGTEANTPPKANLVRGIDYALI